MQVYPTSYRPGITCLLPESSEEDFKRCIGATAASLLVPSVRTHLTLSVFLNSKFLTRDSYAVERLRHDVFVRLPVTDVLWINRAREGLTC